MITSLGPDWLLSLGGFGEQGGKHMRVTDITLINVPTQQCVTADPKVNNKETEGIFFGILFSHLSVKGKLVNQNICKALKYLFTTIRCSCSELLTLIVNDT